MITEVQERNAILQQNEVALSRINLIQAVRDFVNQCMHRLELLEEIANNYPDFARALPQAKITFGWDKGVRMSEWAEYGIYRRQIKEHGGYIEVDEYWYHSSSSEFDTPEANQRKFQSSWNAHNNPTVNSWLENGDEVANCVKGSFEGRVELRTAHIAGVPADLIDYILRRMNEIGIPKERLFSPIDIGTSLDRREE